MKFIMMYETAPDGLQKAQTNFPAHRARLAEFHARGSLLTAGPLVNPTDGAIGVFANRKAAEEFIQGDPFMLNGVVSKCTIREWNEVLA